MRADRHPSNAPGDFYVANGCCTMCMVPFVEAPGLFGEVQETDGTSHCYVQRQPATQDEVDGMLRAVWHSELACLRYAGTDPHLLTRFDEYGEGNLCDAAHSSANRVFRNHVRFASATQRLAVRSALELKSLFKGFLLSPLSRCPPIKFSEGWDAGGNTGVSIAWFEENYHPVEFTPLDAACSVWLVRHSSTEKLGSKAVSWLLHDWLRSEPRFKDPRWFSQEEWEAGIEGRPSPW